jgi:hypothetical protein
VTYRLAAKHLNIRMQGRQFWEELPLTPQDIDLLGRLFPTMSPFLATFGWALASPTSE